MLLNDRWSSKDLWDHPKRRQAARQDACRCSQSETAARVSRSIDLHVFDTP